MPEHYEKYRFDENGQPKQPPDFIQQQTILLGSEYAIVILGFILNVFLLSIFLLRSRKVSSCTNLVLMTQFVVCNLVCGGHNIMTGTIMLYQNALAISKNQCNEQGVLATFGYLQSLQALATIALDRYLILIRGQQMQIKSALLFMVLVNSVVLILCILPIFISEHAYVVYDSGTYCALSTAPESLWIDIISWVLLGYSFLCHCVYIISYWLIIRHLRRNCKDSILVLNSCGTTTSRPNSLVAIAERQNAAQQNFPDATPNDAFLRANDSLIERGDAASSKIMQDPTNTNINNESSKNNTPASSADAEAQLFAGHDGAAESSQNNDAGISGNTTGSQVAGQADVPTDPGIAKLCGNAAGFNESKTSSPNQGDWNDQKCVNNDKWITFGMPKSMRLQLPMMDPISRARIWRHWMILRKAIIITGIQLLLSWPYLINSFFLAANESVDPLFDGLSSMCWQVTTVANPLLMIFLDTRVRKMIIEVMFDT